MPENRYRPAAEDPEVTIARLEKENIRLQEKLEKLQKASLEGEQGAETVNHDLTSFWQEYPVIALVAELHQGGKSTEEIIVELTDKRKILTNLQAGGLTLKKLSWHSDEAMKQAIYRKKKNIVTSDK